MLNDKYAFIPGLHIERAGPGDRTGVESMLSDIVNEIANARARHEEVRERRTFISRAVQELQDRSSVADAELQKARAHTWDETLELGAACATRDTAMQLSAQECEAQLLRDSADLGKYVRLPASVEQELVTIMGPGGAERIGPDGQFASGAIRLHGLEPPTRAQS